jgi:predicted TIM-barrel fold metal-dependent hydrolase
MAEFDQTGRSSWTSDLAEIPEKYGVKNVYGDLGQIFAWTAVAQPRLAAALMGMLVKGLGPDRILWGTDAVWTGAPQWQIEGLRRLEIPEDMQKKYGFKPLGPADGPVKTAVFSGNSARLYGLEQHAETVRHDRFAALKAEYEAAGPGRSNLRYGYVARPA